MSIARRIGVAVAIAGSVVTPAIATAQRASPGYAYHLRMTSRVTRPNGRTTDYVVMAGNAIVTEQRGRFDIDEASRESGALPQKGSYILYDSTSMTIVSPRDRQIVSFPLVGLERALSSAGVSGTLVKISDVAVNFEKLGAGETMLGMATTKFRITQDYKVAAKSALTSRNDTEHVVQDFWMADEQKGFANPFARLALFRAGPGSGFDEILTRTAEAHSRMGRGVPLKTVTTATSTSNRNEVTQTVTTMEVTDLEAEKVDDDILVAPADYQLVDARELARSAPNSPAAPAGEPAKVARPAATGDAAAEAKQGFVKTLHGMGRRP
jgi:hypothetical protein